jgi:hypothetical protein
MKIKAIRLRNLTSGVLHTNNIDMKEDIELIVGLPIINTFSDLVNASIVIVSFLEERLPAEFFENGYVPNCQGEIEINPLTSIEQELFMEAFNVKPK